MSGGYFDYKQYSIGCIAEDVEELILKNRDETLDEYGDPVGHFYSDETIAEFQRGLHYLRLARIYAQRIDWLVSGDDGEESFHRNLQEELDEFIQGKL
jgi:hypothetical protein